MKKFLATLATSLFLVTGFTVQPAFAACSMTGSGTSADPFIVLNQTDLSKIGVVEVGGCITTYNMNQHYRLGANIALTGNFTPVEIQASGAYSGGLDGNNKTISGLNVSRSGQDYSGLFGGLRGATIQNLTITGASVVGANFVGALAGFSRDSSVTNVKVTLSGDVSGTSQVGGLIGSVEGGSIQSSWFKSTAGAVRGGAYVGGAFGSLTSNSVNGIGVMSDIVATNIAGGIAGTFKPSGTSSFDQWYYDTRSNGSGLIGDQYVGGLVGYLWNGGATANVSMTRLTSRSFVKTVSVGYIPNAAIGHIGNGVSSISVSESYFTSNTYKGSTTFVNPMTIASGNVTPTYSQNYYDNWNAVTYSSGATVVADGFMDEASDAPGWTVALQDSGVKADSSARWVVTTAGLFNDMDHVMPASLYNAGFFGAVIDRCEAGNYSNTGGVPCTPAQPGRYVPTTGATIDIPCVAGTYQPNFGSNTCIAAIAGFYVDSSAATAPTPCLAGYTSTPSALSCSLIPTGGGGSGGGSSAPTIPTVTSNPSLTGTVATGQMIVADNGTWKADWPLNYSYKWLRCGKPVAAGSSIPAEAACVEIPTEIGKWYVITPADLKKFVTVEITASDETNKGVFVAGSVNAKGLKYLAFGKKPTISGKAKVGKTLTVGKLTWASAKPTKTTYQWYRCATPVISGEAIASDCKAISGAKKSSYQQTAADKKKYLTVKVGAALGSDKVSSTAGLTAKTS